MISMARRWFLLVWAILPLLLIGIATISAGVYILANVPFGPRLCSLAILVILLVIHAVIIGGRPKEMSPSLQRDSIRFSTN